MAYRGLTQRIARIERRHAQRIPHRHVVWLEVGEAWDGDLSALRDADRVIMLPRKAPSVEVWMQQVRQWCPAHATRARTPPYEQESEVTHATPVHDLPPSAA
jgi:hypothetical protein